MSNLPVGSILLLADDRGIYIPHEFARAIKEECLLNVDASDIDVLRFGPEHEHYWDAWDSVIQSAIVIDDEGKRYHVWQDGDCWLVPVDADWSEGE